MEGLADKVAVVTGGSSGIGKAVVASLSRYGAKVIVIDKAESSTQSEASLFLKADVSDESSLDRCLPQIAQDFNRIDILVNNAAEFIIRGIDASREEWDRAYAVNVFGYANVARACLPLMKVRGGSIVNLSSVSGVVAQRNHMTYSATKGAICSLTRCMALDFSSFGIRVNAVCPGMIWTEANASYLKQSRGLDRHMADSLPEFGGQHLLKRMGDPSEVAEVVSFYSSDLASFATGSIIMVDGGLTAI